MTKVQNQGDKRIISAGNITYFAVTSFCASNTATSPEFSLTGVTGWECCCSHAGLGNVQETKDFG